jgi:predicted HTH domain antitoxin
MSAIILPPKGRARDEQQLLRPRIISVEDAARYANVSRAKFYEYFMRRVKTVKIGRRRGIELASLDAVLDELAAQG